MNVWNVNLENPCHMSILILFGTIGAFS